DDRARGLGAEAAGGERVHGLVGDAGGARGAEGLAQEIELAAPGEQIGAPELERALRQGAQVAVDEDPAPPGARRGLLDEHAELLAQRERAARGAAEEGAGRVLAQEAAGVGGADHAAGARAGLEHVGVEAGLRERARRGEAAETAADDRDPHAVRADSSRTAVTIARTCS